VLLLVRSNFPISRNRPRGARQRTDACSFSSERELRTMSTPLPCVCDMTSCSKEVSRELPMFWSNSWVTKRYTDIIYNLNTFKTTVPSYTTFKEHISGMFALQNSSSFYCYSAVHQLLHEKSLCSLLPIPSFQNLHKHFSDQVKNLPYVFKVK
jgi:hypothetical protein